MDGLTMIRERASIRAFRPKTIPETDIRRILEAGCAAPSAMNCRPYSFLIATDNAFWRSFAAVKPSCQIAGECGLSVLILGEEDKQPLEEFLLADCSAVAENILLAATALGYGSLWVGIRHRDAFEKRIIEHFHLPAAIRPIALLLIGEAAKENPRPDRYDETKIHRGRW